MVDQGQRGIVDDRAFALNNRCGSWDERRVAVSEPGNDEIGLGGAFTRPGRRFREFLQG